MPPVIVIVPSPQAQDARPVLSYLLPPKYSLQMLAIQEQFSAERETLCLFLMTINRKIK